MNKIANNMRVIVGSLFIASSIGKGVFYPTFINEINYYAIIDSDYAAYAANIILASEFIIGLLLLFNKYTKIAALSGIILLTVFIAAKTSVILRGIDLIDCKCFGTLLSLPIWASYILGILMISLLVVTMYAKPINTNFSWKRVYNQLKWG